MAQESEKQAQYHSTAIWRSPFGLEVAAQFSIAWPMILTNLIAYAIIVVSIMFVGHLGELELSSASFANSLASITGFTVLMGLASALETTSGQAFGAKKFHLLGTYLQAAILCLLMVALPISCLWWNMEPILIWLGQDPTIAYMAGLYIRALLPALFANAFIQTFIKFLQTQGVVLPMMICSLITLIIHFPLVYVLVYKLSFGGFIGGALAIDISYWILALQLVAYSWWLATNTSEERRPWQGFQKDAFRAMLPFLRLAIPSALMLCVQFWAFEILTFLSGLLPNPERELSFLSICLNTAGLLFSIPFGLSAAASTRVSHALGSGDTKAAKLATKVVLGISGLQVAVVASCILLLGKLWARAFSDVQDVIDYTSTAMPLLAVSVVFDGVQGVLSGVARGCGRQDLCAIVNIVSVYAIGLPAGLLLGFHFELHARGLFMGTLTGLFSYTCILSVVILKTNWAKMSEEARGRSTGPQEPLLLPS